MNAVDSSGWLEYFADGPNAGAFLPALKDSASIVVPAVTIYEVFKVVLRERGENEALQAVAAMQKGLVVDVSAKLAVEAARLSHKHGLPMADSLVLATAQAHAATIWTQDAHFRSLPAVKYFPKTK
jgi:predicted nucleic acid-binding protein